MQQLSWTKTIYIFWSISLCLALPDNKPTNKTKLDYPATLQPVIDHVGTYAEVIVSGIRIEDHSGQNAFLGYTEKGVNIVKPLINVRVVLFGIGFNDLSAISFTSSDSCDDKGAEIEQADFLIMTNYRLVVEHVFENTVTPYQLCIATKPVRGEALRFHAIPEMHTRVSTEVPPVIHYFSIPVQLGIISVFLVLSGLFSGLNLGLMSLNVQELTLISKSGSKTERKYADAILPVRKNGNYLLCTLLIGNVFVNSAISILLDDLIGSGLLALIGSSAGIVFFGEIFPQALCVKKGLAVGAKTIMITRIFMILTFPASFPISYVLGKLLGEEVVSFDRKRLMELIRMQCESGDMPFVRDEFKIALGALQIWDKTVSDVMTKIDDVFMLPSTAKLGTRAVAEILRMGYTRIPIYEESRNNVVSLLFVKDLALLDPEDSLEVATVCNIHEHVLRFVTEDTPLRILLEEFKKGDYHLAMVHKVVCTDDADPSYELVGLVTLEDIFEEILQAEIVDETDAVIDNVNRKKRFGRKNHDMQYLMDAKNPKCAISVQMQLVTVQWLSTFHPAFSPQYISQSILEKLIRQHCKKIEITMFNEINEPGAVVPRAAKLYTKNEFSDKFILILEGRALCTIGQDNMVFDAGPWQVFGFEILAKLVSHFKQTEDVYRSHSSLSTIERYKEFGFYPDYTMTVKQECTFIEISANDWLLAYKSSMLTLKQNAAVNSSMELLRTTSRSSLADLQPKSIKNVHLLVENRKKRSRSESEHQHHHTERSPLCDNNSLV